MQRLWLGFALVLAFLGVNFASAQLPPGPVPTLHVMSFCPTGCDSTATTWAVPGGTSQVWDTYCGTGGSGGGGVALSADGGGGGGAGGTCFVNYPILAAPGTVLTLNYAAGQGGGTAGVNGKCGTASNVTWTQGAFSFASPMALSGSGGNLGSTTTGGAGGQSNCTQNTAVGGIVGSGITAATGGAGGAPGANGGQAVGTLGPSYFPGMAGGGGGNGGSATGNGGGSRILYQLNTGQQVVLGGAVGNSNTAGGGGAGGSCLFGMGGVGGTYGSTGLFGGQICSGGGGGPSNGTGANGGDGIHILSWIQ